MDLASTATNAIGLDDSVGMAKHPGMRVLTDGDFIAGTPPAPLAADEIHIWLCNGHGGGDARDTIRRLLGAYLRIDADSIGIERDAHGKPYLSQPAGAEMAFNVSHSGASLIVAIARSQALGIDIERRSRVRPWLALARRFFTVEEHQFLASLPAAGLEAAFLELWSCKEAVVKALGRGIAFGLHRLGFAWARDGHLAHLARIAAEAGDVEEWHVVRLALSPGIVGALAWHGPARRLRAFLVADQMTAR